MNDRRMFTRKASAGYGARIFLKVTEEYDVGGDDIRKMHDVLKTLSHWGGSDKRENFAEELYLGYEMDQDLCDALSDNLQKRGWVLMSERQLHEIEREHCERRARDRL